MKRLEGIVPVLVSPINEDATIDVEGYQKLVDYTLAEPIGGYWILGSASEDFLITQEDRIEITRIVAERVAGRVPVIVGCGTPVLSDMMTFFDKTADMQIDAYHLLPTDRKMKPSLAYKYCTEVADRAPKPIWLYNNEKRALKIPVAVGRDLSQHPNVAGIKAAGYDLADIIPFCAMDSAEFQTIGSGGGHLLVFLVMGCSAHTVSMASCFPKQYCEIFDLFMEKKLDEARQKSFALGRLIKSLPHPENTEFCAEEKIVLKILGICQRHCYPPFAACTDDETEKVRRVLEEFGILEHCQEYS